MNEIKYVLEQIWLGHQEAGLEILVKFQLWFGLALAIFWVATSMWSRARRAKLAATSIAILCPSLEGDPVAQPGVIQATA